MAITEQPDDTDGTLNRRPGAAAAVERWFAIRERGSTLRREALAGVSTFLALSYIVVVNPAILAQAGIPRSAVFLATAGVGGLATIVMGLLARLPLAVAPGMEMNALIALSVVATLGYSWQQALGMVFWSGLAMLVVSLLRLREAVINAIPAAVRPALTAAVGVFVGLVGLQIGRVVTTSGGHLSGLGNLTSGSAFALYLGLCTALLVDRLGARSVAVLAGIAVSAVFCAADGVTAASGAGAGGGWAALFRFAPSVITDPRAWSVILVLFALDFFGSIAKVVGLTAPTALARDGQVPGMRQALLVDAGATVVGAATGSSSFVAFVESAVGIRAGARTGVAAIVTGALLMSCLFFAPVLTHVPTQATSGILVFVAIKMLTADRPATPQLLARVVTACSVVVTVTTLAIDQAMAASFVVCLVADLARRRRPRPAVVVTTVLLVASVVIQYLT